MKSKKINKILFLVGPILILIILIIVFLLSGKEHKNKPNPFLGVKEDIADNYIIEGDKVYYEQFGNRRLIEGAQAGNFKAINNFYGKDSDHVYFRNILIDGADPETFEPFDETASKDADDVYCSDISVYKKVLPEADVESFEKIGETFYKDKDHVFEKCRILDIADLDPETFEVLAPDKVKDKNGVYSIK